MTTYRLGVIGNPIAHSLSPYIHQKFARQFNLKIVYERILASDDNFDSIVFDFFKSNGKGLNITSPFKRQAFLLSDEQTAETKCSLCANTLFMANNQLIADSTDGYGFQKSVARYVDITKKRVLILGAGDVVGAVLPKLFESKPNHVVIANRTRSNADFWQKQYPQLEISAYELLKGGFDIIINAAGPHIIHHLPSIKGIFDKSVCVDLAYANKPTSFMTYAHANGAIKVKDGLDMLLHQGAKSFHCWFGLMPKLD